MSSPYLSERVIAGERRLGIVDNDGVWRMARRFDSPRPYTRAGTSSMSSSIPSAPTTFSNVLSRRFASGLSCYWIARRAKRPPTTIHVRTRTAHSQTAPPSRLTTQ